MEFGERLSHNPLHFTWDDGTRANNMQFTHQIALIALVYLVAGISSQCDKSILPELTFRLGGTNLDWPCYSTKNIYASTGRYIPKHVIATRAQIYRDEAFVALPRYRSGVPFSLGVISLKKGQCSTPIRPYPSWELQEEGNCNAFQNVVDVFLDNQVCVCRGKRRARTSPIEFSPFEPGFFFLSFFCRMCSGYWTRAS